MTTKYRTSHDKLSSDILKEPVRIATWKFLYEGLGYTSGLCVVKTYEEYSDAKFDGFISNGKRNITKEDVKKWSCLILMDFLKIFAKNSFAFKISWLTFNTVSNAKVTQKLNDICPIS